MIEYEEKSRLKSIRVGTARVGVNHRFSSAFAGPRNAHAPIAPGRIFFLSFFYLPIPTLPNCLDFKCTDAPRPNVPVALDILSTPVVFNQVVAENNERTNGFPFQSILFLEINAIIYPVRLHAE